MSYNYPTRTTQAGGHPAPTHVVKVNNNNGNSSSDMENCCGDGVSDFLYKWRWPIGILMCIGAFLMVVLLPISFSYVEAGQVGLPENRVSGNVDEDGRVYTMTLEQNGRYYLGPDKTIQPFDARVQQKVFELDVIASNSRGFELHVVCFYRIKQAEVGQLFTKFTQNWETPAQNEVVSTIKSIAPQFDIPDYVTNLNHIRSVMAYELTTALDADHLVTVDYKLLILRADFTGDINNQYLQTVVQVQTNERQLIQREVDIITQDTETQRQAILANKTLVEATGQANATRIVETARAEANKRRELARTIGFTALFDFFNVTNSTTKVSYLEWYALKNNLNRVTILDGVSSVIVQTP